MAINVNPGDPHYPDGGHSLWEEEAVRNQPSYPHRPKPMTNADRIRAMSDEELAAVARRQIACGRDFFPCGVVCGGQCEANDSEECYREVIAWLQQPAEEVHNEA